MALATQTGELLPYQNGYVVPLNPRDSLFLIVNDQYMVASNRFSNAAAMAGGGKGNGQLSSNLVSTISAHPFSTYFDITESFKNIDLTSYATHGEADIYKESSRLLTNVSLNGGEFKDHAMQSHLEVNFTNTEESSIITLLDFGMKISDAMEKIRVNATPQTVDTASAAPEARNPADDVPTKKHF